MLTSLLETLAMYVCMNIHHCETPKEKLKKSITGPLYY